MKLNAEKITAISSALLVFGYTYMLGSLFVGGDQEHYRAVYDVSSQNSIEKSYFYYRSRIQSDEVGHFLLTWVASQFLEKDLFNALANSILAFFSVRIFTKWGAHPLMAFVISLFSYYHLAMYLSAERLKFATIFFVIGAFYFSRSRFSYWFFLMSVVTHLQYVLMLMLFFFNKFFTSMRSAVLSLKVKYSDVSWFLLFTLFVLFLVTFFLDHIIYKLSAYYEEFVFSEYVRIAVFFLGALFYSRTKKDVVLYFFPLFLAVALVGGDRVNLFGYFLFLLYALPVRRGFNFGVISTTIYFGFGWAQYVLWVIECGLNHPC